MSDMLAVCSRLTLRTRSPAAADFIGRGNLWVNNTYEPSVIALARRIILEAITRTAPGQLSVLGYDRDLSGIFAPFASLWEEEPKILKLISDEKEFLAHLSYLRQQIQAVQNVIQGRCGSLLDFRASLRRPVEGYQLVVLSLDMGLLEQEVRARLSLLMRSGPAAGISFLIISPTLMSVQTGDGEEIPLSVEAIAPNITVLEGEKLPVFSGGEGQADAAGANAEAMIRRCERFREQAREAQLPVVEFGELHDLSERWARDSIDGVSCVIGKYGLNDMEITLGDEVNQRHNALITGAVGQGKSNLISVMIHSLCLRYSPGELELYLLDFKEGVTFKPFSNIGQDEYLPHARALGLECDVSFGLAVLEALYGEYQQRMKRLKEYNVKSIRELRRAFPDMRVPRIVVIIDEFQMMFGDEPQTAQKIGDLLEKSVRLFRAAGIHFVLASQTLSRSTALLQKWESIFGQMPIRIALKNTMSESRQTLAENNSAAAFLRPREAIVNLDYGQVSQNRKIVTAYADEEALRPLRKVWWERARAECPAPYVFESERRITISRGIPALGQLRKGGRHPMAVIGERISIDGEIVALPLSSEAGRNIAIIGTPDGSCNQAMGMLQSIAISLAFQNTKGNARFLFCDFQEKEREVSQNYPHFARIMEQAGYYIESLPAERFQETIRDLSSQEASEDRIYVFAAALDRWRYEKDPYGQGSPLKEFAETAPDKGMHLIGWWVKASSFTAQVAGFGSSDAFNSKIFLRVDERTVQSMTSPFIRWSARENRALVSDSVEFAQELSLIPYAPVTQEDVNRFKTQVWN